MISLDNPQNNNCSTDYLVVKLEAYTDVHDVLLPPRSEQTTFEVPTGFERVILKAYKSAEEIIVPSQLGVRIDSDDDDNCVHDCCLMGCTEGEHIVARFPVR